MALRLALRRLQFHKIYGHREFLGPSSLLGPGWDAFEVTLGCARVPCVSTSTGPSSKNLEEPARPLPFVRSRARIVATRDSLIRTRDSLRATRGRVSADVRQTKRIVSERIGNLKENVFTVPNALSLARLCSSPVLGYLVVTGSYTPALVLFGAAGITDVVRQQTGSGRRSCLRGDLCPFVPVPLTALILARDGIILGCAGYLRFVSLPSPRTLARYFDVTLATVKFTPTTISKVISPFKINGHYI
ncbi:cdp-diacylglycerol--glycerol-3-phosphate 3-phosphatidyltransferase, putative [Ixodes scapularis]|uniref:Cdp-diacylglycerol--glycerol-3-phosphate 3-phosphatidyltransferase, putative n=1 Tax=Ixodes scapularis TaxID=6945 RepID=B7Q0E5_IXOSC|nr:cdp-diacylglycerol--glycerol-3-phosphate 3-phosphatidyltransferase, putative [Ixodes scapularis]|eukprot:XP_002407490.1 cdp-diacylglycerol--glycerol-3-phosphate 3-phosphatidyltransferase, putative [Ixodes scapularis]